MPGRDERLPSVLKIMVLSGQTRACLCLALLMTSGCVAGRVNLKESNAPGARMMLVSAIGNDSKGLPVPGPVLAKRPSRPGDHFTILRMTDGRPELSCDVAVVGGDPDFRKPFRAVYEWTGEGLRLGLGISEGMAQGLQGASGQGAIVGLAIVITPIPLGIAGGFVLGVADGIEKTFEEIGKAVTKDEQAITCTTYEYDDHQRLLFMHLYLPDYSRELFRTGFEYEGNNTVPRKAVVRNLEDGRERVIR